MVLLANKQLFAWKNEPERERGGGGGIIDFRNQVRQSPRNSKRVIAKPRQVCTQSIIFHFKNIFSYIEEKKEKKTHHCSMICFADGFINTTFLTMVNLIHACHITYLHTWAHQPHFFNHGDRISFMHATSHIYMHVWANK
jgi:hypothetical protein